MEKLDIAADYYKNKELKDITPAVLDFMVKSTEALENIATIEGMEQYADEMAEMSGAPRRSSRTGRFIRGDVMRDSRMMRRSYGDRYDYDDGYSYGDEYGHSGGSGEFHKHLDNIIRNSTNEREREAARKLLKEMEGTE